MGAAALSDQAVRKLLSEKGAKEAVGQVLARIDEGLLAKLSEPDLELLQSYIGNRISPSENEQPWLCWASDVSEEKVAAFHAAEELTRFIGGETRLLATQFLGSGGWSRTATNGLTGRVQGNPLVVTWSIVPDGTLAPGLTGAANGSSDFRAWMASIYGGSTGGNAESEVWFEIFQDSFEAVAATCGITLRYEPNDDGSTIRTSSRGVAGTRGDIRIAARALDGNSGTLAFAFAPDSGDMVFDSSDNTFNNTSSSSLLLFNVIAHELGHSLGLAHVCPLNQTKLLEPILTTRFRGPQLDEAQSLQRLYGDPLEVHDDVVNNDSPGNANVIELVEDVSRRFTRLSIDDNGDEDYFQIDALAGQRLTVTVRPGEGTYLEGPQEGDTCTQGTDFDSGAIHDLTLEYLAPDGDTVLAVSDEGELGELEIINQFEFTEDGSYFVKISGDSSNASQLYRVDFRLGDRADAPRLVAGESSVLAESGVVKTGELDANETIRIEIPIANIGELTTGALTANITGSTNVNLFSTEVPASIEADETGALGIVFGGIGECGELVTLTVELSDESGVLLAFEREFRMGNIVVATLLNEEFDASTDLPDGWNSVTTGSGQEWDSVSTRFVSAVRSAFSPGVGSVSESSLISPALALGSEGGTLSFEHLHQIETSFDGAVLEVSRNEGEWFDLIDSPLTTVTAGGYNAIVRTGFESSIEGQNAWSGNLSSFINTTVILPSQWAGDTLRFRWRLVHDSSGSSNGWWIDNVRLEASSDDCEPHRPVLQLALTSGGLDENTPSEGAVLTLSSELPLVEPVTVTLDVGGSASAADFTGGLEVTLPMGQVSVAIPLSVSVDDVTEGEETLTFTIPDDQAAFAPGQNGMGMLTIIDLFTIAEWSGSFFPGEVDLTGDSDGDGLSELAEYLLGTDPTSRTSGAIFRLRQVGDDFLIPLTGLPNRADATLGIQFSNDLVRWQPGSLETSAEGLVIERPAELNHFFRLTFTLDQ